MDLVKERYISFPCAEHCGLSIFRLKRKTFVPKYASLYKFLSRHTTVSHTHRQYHLKEYFCRRYIPGKPSTLPTFPSSEGSLCVVAVKASTAVSYPCSFPEIKLVEH